MNHLLVLAAIVAALCMTAAALAGRRAVFWLGIAPAFLPVEYVDRYHVDLPSAIKWLPYFSLLFAGGAGAILGARRIPIPRPLWVTYGAILVLSGLSIVWNDSSIAAFLVAQRGYVLVFATLAVLRYAKGRSSLDDHLRLIVTLGLISAAVCLVQRFLIVPFVSGEGGDRVTGLFSVGYIAMFYHLFCIAIVLAKWFYGLRVVPWHPGWVLLAFFLALAVANQKAAVPYSLLLLAFLIVRAGPRKVVENLGKVLLAAVVLPPAFFAIFTAIYDSEYRQDSASSFADSIFSRAYIERYLFGDEGTNLTSAGSLRRGAAVAFAYEHISQKPGTLLLGLGPGATSDSRIPGATGHLAARYPDRGINRTALSMLLGDSGLIGVLLHVLFLVGIVVHARRRPREDRLIGEAFVLLALAYYIYGNLYFQPVYAILIAFLYHAGRPETAVTALPDVTRVKGSRAEAATG